MRCPHKTEEAGAIPAMTTIHSEEYMKITFENHQTGATVTATNVSLNVWKATAKWVDGKVKEYVRVLGSVNDAINAMKAKGYTHYTISDVIQTEFKKIPGFPMYEFDGMNVRSYHNGQNGHFIKYSRYQDKEGYTLHHEGRRERFTVDQLRAKMKVYEFQDMHLTNKLSEKGKNMSKLFIVGSKDSFGNLSFSTNPKQHFDEQSARQETERLARVNPGKTYVYAEIKASCVVGGAVWK